MPGRTSLAPPPNLSRLKHFPGRTLPHGSELWRVVRKGMGPWWFGNTGGGRFDVPAPHGTCYLASEPLGAILELIGPGVRGGAVSEEFLGRYRMRHLEAPRGWALAELASRRAAGFGVTGEIHTILPYDLPQAWANSLLQAGFRGLSHRLRHDPSGRSRGIALFGRAGERRSWRRGRELSIVANWAEALKRRCQIRVMPIPRASELSVIE